MAEERRRPTPRTAEETAEAKQGVVTGFFVSISKLISTLIGSLFVSVMVALLGVIFVWPERGASHERETLITELNALSESLSNAGSSLSSFVASGVTSAFEHWWGPSAISSVVTVISGFFSDQAQLYGEVALLACQIFVVRLGVIVSSVPVFGLWVLLAIVVGLTERDLRRWNVGTESSTIFNLAVENVSLPCFLCVALYLSWPVKAYALLGIMPVCFGTFVAIVVAISRYKKRL